MSFQTHFKSITIFFAIASLAVSATADLVEEPSDSSPAITKESTAEAVRISQLASNPEAYVGKRVRLIGLVDDVCPVRGCWANVRDAEDGTQIRFKVPDGDLVFTAKMIGDVVEAKGVFARYTMGASGRYERTLQPDYVGQATYLLEGRDASLICSENKLASR